MGSPPRAVAVAAVAARAAILMTRTVSRDGFGQTSSAAAAAAAEARSPTRCHSNRIWEGSGGGVGSTTTEAQRVAQAHKRTNSKTNAHRAISIANIHIISIGKRNTAKKKKSDGNGVPTNGRRP
ncbi:hypothetical protein I4F81_006701 [Pyropia yezoensis]|uniref:Uncharacterized protein n=1 Tax=Pyropia yezoensis TaxID=2788 RepID=A0ACC3C1I3_PYRYE|nr:hypothetical protein I4F81_006701 [Neopyropia yezoensis]